MKTQNFEISDCHPCSFFFIWANDRYQKIHIDQIAWVEASRSYCDISTISGKIYTICIPMLHVSKYLTPEKFLRISRKHIVNIELVDILMGNRLFIGPKNFLVTDSYRKEVFSRFQFVGCKRSFR